MVAEWIDSTTSISRIEEKLSQYMNMLSSKEKSLQEPGRFDVSRSWLLLLNAWVGCFRKLEAMEASTYFLQLIQAGRLDGSDCTQCKRTLCRH